MEAKLLILVAGISCASAGIVDPNLREKFFFGGGGGGNGTQNVLISFSQSLQTIFDQIDRMNFTSQDNKRETLTRMEMQFTEVVQRGLKSFLQIRGVNSESFWISNSMVVKNVDWRLATLIANFPGVAKVEEEPVFHLNLPQYGVEEEGLERFSRQSNLAWGISRIKANDVWNMGYRGRGIVVANIDTGVRYTHESLRSRWRQSYGWFDPFQRTSTPNDQNGHGSHVMGTIAGANGVGVAPEATWIACKGCSGSSCDTSALLRCGEWVQCPTDTRGNNRDCTRAPNVVCNSWGGGGNSNFYDRVIDSWQRAGITPVFAIGNAGPNCNTGGSPGDRQNVIAVGDTDSSQRISRTSSLGPAGDGRLKPDISAPGTQIRSAWHTSDNAYNTISGTSMAAPHVTGVVVLMKNKRSSLSYQQIYNAVTSTANTQMDTRNARTCGNRPGNRFPNNVFGYGEIDAVRSVNAV